MVRSLSTFSIANLEKSFYFLHSRELSFTSVIRVSVFALKRLSRCPSCGQYWFKRKRKKNGIFRKTHQWSWTPWLFFRVSWLVASLRFRFLGTHRVVSKFFRKFKKYAEIFFFFKQEYFSFFHFYFSYRTKKYLISWKLRKVLTCFRTFWNFHGMEFLVLHNFSAGFVGKVNGFSSYSIIRSEIGTIRKKIHKRVNFNFSIIRFRRARL